MSPAGLVIQIAAGLHGAESVMLNLLCARLVWYELLNPVRFEDLDVWICYQFRRCREWYLACFRRWSWWLKEKLWVLGKKKLKF